MLPVFATLSLCALAQQDPDAIRQAMNTSLERQRKSIRIQVSAGAQVRARAKNSNFFATDGPPASDCEPLAQSEVNNLIENTAQKEGVDPRLVREVARQESGFRPCAVSAKGAIGLMQLMPSTAKDLELENPFDPRGNITAGSRFLKLLLDRYDGGCRVRPRRLQRRARTRRQSGRSTCNHRDPPVRKHHLEQAFLRPVAERCVRPWSCKHAFRQSHDS